MISKGFDVVWLRNSSRFVVCLDLATFLVPKCGKKYNHPYIVFGVNCIEFNTYLDAIQFEVLGKSLKSFNFILES